MVVVVRVGVDFNDFTLCVVFKAAIDVRDEGLQLCGADAYFAYRLALLWLGDSLQVHGGAAQSCGGDQCGGEF